VRKQTLVLIAVLFVFAIKVHGAAPACPSDFEPLSKDKLKAEISAAQTKPLRIPTRDFRLYLYEEGIQGEISHDQKIEQLARKTGVHYIHSVDSIFRPASVAFFKAAHGEVFGVSHFDLADEGTKNLLDIKEIVDKKITDKNLDHLFAKDGYGFFRPNLKSEKGSLNAARAPLLSDPSLELFGLNEDLYLATRSSETEFTKVEVIETIASASAKNHKSQSGGRELQTKLINEILDFILPLYAERRGWSQEFIADLRTKALASADSTKYILVRDKQTGEILATMGLTRAPYGKAILRNGKTMEWQEAEGPFGETIAQDALGPRLPTLDLLGTKIPTLPMEKYLGKLLPRPAVIDFVTRAVGSRLTGLASWLQPKNSNHVKIQPSVYDPLFLSSGTIFEPTKFAVAKNFAAKKIARTQVIRELFSSVFDLRYQNEFIMNGQELYTYNDRNGVRLYQALGFELMSDRPINKDGTDWYLLKLSPHNLMNTMKSDQFMSDDQTKDLVEMIENQIFR
jgi:hypothetical protein